MFSLKNIIKKIAPDTFNSILNEGVNKQIKATTTEREKFNKISFEINHEIGSFIIASPNEYDDLIIGEIIAHDLIGKSQVAIVHDYLRNTEVLLLQKAYPYSNEFAEVLSNLSPDMRHVLIYGHTKDFKTINKDTLIGWEHVKKQLENNRFFDKLK